MLSTSEPRPRGGVMPTTAISWSCQPPRQEMTSRTRKPRSWHAAKQTPLSYEVFVAAEMPFKAPPPRVGDPQAWAPVTSTLIFGARDAVLVDSLETRPRGHGARRLDCAARAPLRFRQGAKQRLSHICSNKGYVARTGC